MNEIPVYEHDCDHCIYLGSDHPRGGERQVNAVDLYYHDTPSGPTLIRRYSSDGPDYSAVPHLCAETLLAQEPDHPFAENRRRLAALLR